MNIRIGQALSDSQTRLLFKAETAVKEIHLNPELDAFKKDVLLAASLVREGPENTPRAIVALRQALKAKERVRKALSKAQLAQPIMLLEALVSEEQIVIESFFVCLMLGNDASDGYNLAKKTAIEILGHPIEKTGPPHVTMVYAGDVKRSDLPLLKAAISKSINLRRIPISLNLRGISYFPSGKHGTPIWVGIKQCRRLQDIRAKVFKAIEPWVTVKQFDGYHPHVTLGYLPRELTDDEKAFLDAENDHYGAVSVESLSCNERGYATLFKVPVGKTLSVPRMGGMVVERIPLIEYMAPLLDFSIPEGMRVARCDSMQYFKESKSLKGKLEAWGSGDLSLGNDEWVEAGQKLAKMIVKMGGEVPEINTDDTDMEDVIGITEVPNGMSTNPMDTVPGILPSGRYNTIKAKAEKGKPTSAEYKEFKAKHGGDTGVSLGKDKDGFYVYTHRARSKSFKSPGGVSKDAVTKIERTGSTKRRYFHGTSSKFLKSIKRKGLSASPPQRVWEGNLAPIPGHVYLTTSIVIAVDAADTAARKFKGDPMVLVVELDRDDPRVFADEDLIPRVSNRIINQNMHMIPRQTRMQLWDLWDVVHGHAPDDIEQYSREHAELVAALSYKGPREDNLGSLLKKWASREDLVVPKFARYYFEDADPSDYPRFIKTASDHMLEDMEKYLRGIGMTNFIEPSRAMEFLVSDVPDDLDNASKEGQGNRARWFIKHRARLQKHWPEWFGPEAGMLSNMQPTVAVQDDVRVDEFWTILPGKQVIRRYNDLPNKAKRVAGCFEGKVKVEAATKSDPALKALLKTLEKKHHLERLWAHVKSNGDEDKAFSLDMIKVDPEYAREGHGSKAMKELMKFADDNDYTVVLDTKTDKRAKPSPRQLQKWYKSFGFKANKGRTKDYRFRETMIRLPATTAHADGVITAKPEIFRMAALDSRLKAYHAGGKLQGKKFDLKHLGSGEGMSALGPGIYFATNIHIAMRYAKYASNAHMYEVEIDTSGIYESRSGQPRNLRDALDALEDYLASQNGGKLPAGNVLKDGPGAAGDIIRHLGITKGRQALLDIGITGLVERLPRGAGGLEISVFDPSIVRILTMEPITEAMRVQGSIVLAEGEEGEEEEGGDSGQRKSDPLPAEFRTEMEGKGKTFTNPETNNKVLFDSLPWKEQLKYYKEWKRNNNKSDAPELSEDDDPSLEDNAEGAPKSDSGESDSDGPGIPPKGPLQQELSNGRPAATGANLHEDTKTAFTEVATEMGLSDEQKSGLQEEIFTKDAEEVDGHAANFRKNRDEYGFAASILMFLIDLGVSASHHVKDYASKIVKELKGEVDLIKDESKIVKNEVTQFKNEVIEHYTTIVNEGASKAARNLEMKTKDSKKSQEDRGKAKLQEMGDKYKKESAFDHQAHCPHCMSIMGDSRFFMLCNDCGYKENLPDAIMVLPGTEKWVDIPSDNPRLIKHQERVEKDLAWLHGKRTIAPVDVLEEIDDIEKGITAGSDIVMYHGGQRFKGTPVVRQHKKGHAEHGPGIYLTTSWTTARKYAKGGGAVHRVTLKAPGQWLENARINTKEAMEFIRYTLGKGKKAKAVAEYLYKWEDTTEDTMPAESFVIAFINNDAASGRSGPPLAEFLTDHGIDASLVSSQSNEDWIVVFNPRIIKKIEKLTPKDVDAKGFPFDLPLLTRTAGYTRVAKMPRVQYHATSWDKVSSILRKGLQLPRDKQDVSTFVHDLPSISTADKPGDAQIYHPRGALLELRVKPGFKYLKRTSRMMRRGESLINAVNRWGQEALDKGAAGFWMEGWQSTVGNQTYNPDALEVVRVVNEETTDRTAGYAEDAERILEWVNSFGDPIRLYREIVVPTVEDIDFDKLGRYWTPIKEKADSPYGKSEKGKPFVVEIEARRRDVDEKETVSTFRRYPGEREIRLKRNSKIDIIGIWDENGTFLAPKVKARTGSVIDTSNDVTDSEEAETEAVFEGDGDGSSKKGKHKRFTTDRPRVEKGSKWVRRDAPVSKIKRKSSISSLLDNLTKVE